MSQSTQKSNDKKPAERIAAVCELGRTCGTLYREAIGVDLYDIKRDKYSHKLSAQHNIFLLCYKLLRVMETGQGSFEHRLNKIHSENRTRDPWKSFESLFILFKYNLSLYIEKHKPGSFDCHALELELYGLTDVEQTSAVEGKSNMKVKQTKKSLVKEIKSFVDSLVGLTLMLEQ